MAAAGNFVCLAFSCRLQIAQSAMRKRAAGSRPQFAVGELSLVRAGAARLCSHRDWQGVCLVVRRARQWHDVGDDCREQSGAAGDAVVGCDYRPRKPERHRENAERHFRQSRLQQRWNFRCSAPGNHLAQRSLSQRKKDRPAKKIVSENVRSPRYSFAAIPRAFIFL